MKKFPLCKGRGKDIKGTLKVTAKYGDGSERKKLDKSKSLTATCLKWNLGQTFARGPSHIKKSPIWTKGT